MNNELLFVVDYLEYSLSYRFQCWHRYYIHIIFHRMPMFKESILLAGRNDVNSRDTSNLVDKQMVIGSTSTALCHKIVIVAVGPKVGNGCYNNVSNAQIENFNSKIKNGISSMSNISYCDAYDGFGKKNYKVSGSCEIHYTSDTYIKLYNYIMDNCRT